ncbi:type VII secretion system-associated protein [Jidongwangia harbinensis]|uniref:type VII secretion system-associated protein n=1 Tax=Jidongwangia harbinensis TaxID=2878561 RepID=UPI001CD9956E|nr:type VII secretion system-associated protein [Jidongwangia harbinensis]MCA2217464.1 type VII secretion system-associated protein [Jidongwangia harbinensis]
MPADEQDMENYFLLMDPDWRPQPDEEVPPIEAVIGLWPLAADGSVGPFRSNPGYEPRDENPVTDPLDAMLRLTMQGRAPAEQLQLLMRDALFEVALNGDQRPLIVKSPDDVRCVVVATSMPQVRRISAPQWQHQDLTGVVSLLPDGVDVLFNPGGAVPFRLTGDFLRETTIMSDEEVAAAYETLRAEQGDQRIEVLPWVIGEDDTEVTVEAVPAQGK